MIYFLVNNNYHFIDVLEHCKELKTYEKTLIQIPHTLEALDAHHQFSNVLTFETPFEGFRNLLNVFNIKKTLKTIDTQLQIKPDDILFLYTEFEILNQVLIHKFKKEGAKVYIIEDGGLPTYLTYSVKSDKKLPIKQYLKLLYLRYFIGCRYVEFLYYNNMVFPQINEKYIDGVLLYVDVMIHRDIKKYLIKKNIEKIAIDSTKALLLNEKLHGMYCSKDEYLEILDNLLNRLNKHFEKVYFKFHPRETEEDKKWQNSVINRYNNVVIITDNTPIEQLVDQYNAKYVFSFISAALLNLVPYGITPAYIFHHYPVLNDNPIFQKTKNLLTDLGYIFIDDDFSNISTIGFPDVSDQEKIISLSDLIHE